MTRSEVDSQFFQRSKTAPSEPAAPAAADACARSSAASVVEVCLMAIAALRPHYGRATQKSAKLKVELLVCAYQLLAEATDLASEALIKKEAATLGVKRNRRSGIAHLAIDIAFAEEPLSPSLRTFYASALLAGKARKLTADEFRAGVITGPTGRGGLRSLSELEEPPRKQIDAKDQQIADLAYSPSDSSKFHLGRGRLGEVLLNQEIAEQLEAASLELGDELTIILKVAPHGTFEAVSLLDFKRAAGDAVKSAGEAHP
jgi:hypothetical protein